MMNGVHYLSCSQISQTKCYKEYDAIFKQFLILFQMVCSVLLSMLHFKTILLMDPDKLLKLSHQ